MKYLQGKTLAEKQMHYYNGSKCPYCNNHTELIDSIEVYQQSYGLMYICRPCKAHVGTHKGTDQALGPLAQRPLRDLRHEAHKYFDPIWKKKAEQGYKNARKKAYTWLGILLKVDRTEAHLGFLNEEQCHIVINECKKYIPGTEQHKKHQEEYANSHSAEANFQAIEMMAGTTYDVQVISKTYYDLVHHTTKQKFRFNIDTSVGKWDRPNEVWKKVDISKFIKKHFLK